MDFGHTQMPPLFHMGLDVQLLSEAKKCAIEILHSDGFGWIKDSP